MRFTKPSKRKLKHDARSFPYKRRGHQDEENPLKLWKCWHCGFICDEDRDDHSQGTAGDSQEVSTLPASGGDGLDGMIVSTEIGKETVMMKQDAQGVDVVIEHIYASVITKGCPMCGTTNYKG